MKPTEGYVYCITTTLCPDEFLTNDNGDVLVFESDEQIISWAESKSLDLEDFLVHEVEVLEE
jgi:hypothetical protein